MSFVTNRPSKFTPFRLTLSNGAVLTGIAHLPSKGDFRGANRPLVVGIHGGTCTCHNFDICPEYTASHVSAATGVPFVAFNRPGYLDSTTLLPFSDTTYCQEDGRWNHEYIFPALWKEFGEPNGCIGLVAVCHSMAVPAGIIAGGLYARDSAPAYPLAGLILSGFGTRFVLHAETAGDPNTPPPPKIYFPFAVKRDLMFSEEKWKCVDPALEPLLETQSTHMHLEEMIDLRMQWPTYRLKYSEDVNV